MDFNLKQWRNESEEEDQDQQTSAKLPKLLLNSHHHHQQPPPATSSALPLFVSDPNTNLSAAYSSDQSTTSKFPRMMSSHFSLSQWQELELQALIFRHMIAGATVPQELLHLVKKSIIVSYPPSSYHQYYPHYQPALLQQSGYWGKAAMDPEPGRCRRTDGKKWRCSRDVVAGHKYCERHIHRGRNRSRKPVEIPTPPAAASPYAAAAAAGDTFKTRQGVSTDGGGSSFPHFTLSASPHSSDLLHLNQRPSNSIIETKAPLDQSQSNGNKTLRHFFDDWPPKPLDHDTDNTSGSSMMTSSTKLSISMPENPLSDFSLKLGTGNNGDEVASARVIVNDDRDENRGQVNWGMMTWQNNPAAPMGGPLAEALRSSISNSSPTSVLHRLPPGRASETSYV